MNQESNKDFQEKLLANKVMLNSAEISSTLADKFINWIVAGSGALLSVIFSTQYSLLNRTAKPAFYVFGIYLHIYCATYNMLIKTYYINYTWNGHICR